VGHPGPFERRIELAGGPPPAAARGVEVRRDGEVARRGEPLGLLADVVGEPEGLVEHHDGRPRAVADGRHGEVGLQLGRGGSAWDRDGGDAVLLESAERSIMAGDARNAG